MQPSKRMDTFYILIGSHLQDILLGTKDKLQNSVYCTLSFMQNRREISISIYIYLKKLRNET